MEMESERWAFGTHAGSSYREKLVKDNPLIEIGDIVVSRKFYRNGRSVPPHKFDYMSQPIGVVVNQRYHERYEEEVIVVVWKGDSTTRTNYIKKNASAYLIKLS